MDWGRVGGYKQEGKGKVNRGEEDLPQYSGAARQGGLQQDEELFLVKLRRSRHLGVI